VGVNVCHVYAGLQGALYLGLDFALDGVRVAVCVDGLVVGVKIARRVQQARGGVAGRDGAPAAVFPLAGEGHVYAHVHLLVAPAKGGGGGEPGAGDHDRGGGDEAKIHQVAIGGQRGLAQANVVAVDDDGAVVVGESEFFEEGVGLYWDFLSCRVF
jgi:hypothetical protein